MKQKTISGHYGAVYNLAHNNRDFVPQNVDRHRIAWNYNCVSAGQFAYPNSDDPHHISEFWSRYSEVTQLYWSERSIVQTITYKRYLEHLEYMRRYSRAFYQIPHAPVSGLIALLFLPLLIPCDLYLHHQHRKAKEEWEQFKDEQWLRDMTFKAARVSLRSALHTQDLKGGTHYLEMMDRTVKELGDFAQTYPIPNINLDPPKPSRFATLEEIYDKLYEPSFQAFQAKQRPCRRYHGTYLEQIREGQHKAIKAHQQDKNVRSRKPAEAIEILFMIGDMDNTGYVNAFADAKRAEALLGDFCDHLLAQPNLCCVTTKELNDPDWEPPFQNGLIILNLNVHADEATPGIHLTCIPYSRNCKRGPKVQASMGKALSGMGYPSTWKDELDDKGERIPKRNKSGNILYNRDGSVRYQQTPDQQGILDWIEEQKCWIQKEMKQRYGWDREYKGSHPRGDLSTPDYQVARAKERLREHNMLLEQSLQDYQDRVEDLTLQLDSAVEEQWQNATNQRIIEQYLKICTDEEYDTLAKTAAAYLDRLAVHERQKAFADLDTKISLAERNQSAALSLKNTAHQKTKNRNGK